MSFKKCPFCNNPIEYKIKNNLYSICCDYCKSKGINLLVSAKTLDELKELWNNRTFDDILLDDPEYSIKLLSFLSGKQQNPQDIVNIESDEKYKKYDSIMNSNDIFGYIVLTNGDIVICDEEHTLELIKYVGFDIDCIDKENIDNDEILKMFVENGMIRVSKQMRCLMIDFVPLKVSKLQLNNLSVFLMKNKDKLSDIRLYCVYLNGGDKAEDIKQFDNLNDLILYLDKVI